MSTFSSPWGVTFNSLWHFTVEEWSEAQRYFLRKVQHHKGWWLSNMILFQEALLHRQSKERRIAVTEGPNYKPPSYPKCIFSKKGIRCAARTVPLSKYCFKRILLWHAVFSCDQAALRMVQSVRPSVCLSVTPFWLCSHHPVIMKFSGVITSDKSDVHAKGQGQRSKVKVTEVTTQLNHFRTVTPVWIHIWWWDDAYSLIMLRRGALLFFKVICQISRSHGSKNRRIWPRLGVSGL